MKLKRITSLLLAGLMSVSALAIGASAAESADDGLYHGKMETTTIWNTLNGSAQATGEKQVYNQHRIPGVVTTEKGTVIVYCEARTGIENKKYPGSGGDWSLMDVYIQRSEDGGKTFGNPIYIAEGINDGGDDSYACVNNPVMFVGKNNKLIILYGKDYGINGGSIWMRTSTDDGKTWTPEVDLGYYGKSATYIDEYNGNDEETWAVHKPTLGYDYNAIAFGPTHGILTSNGTLVVPLWISAAKEGRAETSHGSADVHLFYSTDNGETWSMDKTNCFNASWGCGETSISELSDGSLLLNARNDHASKTRAIKTVSAGYPEKSSYSIEVCHPDLPDPGCCGGTAKVDVDGLPYLTLVAGCDSTSARELVTVKCSYDDGNTFSRSLLMEGSVTGKGGYVDIWVDDKGKAYVLWEEQYGKAMYLTTFSVADEFCSDNVAMVADTGAMFDTAKKMEAVTETKNMTATSVDGALHVETTAATTAKYFVLNYSEKVTGIVHMSDYKYMLVRMKVDSSTKDNALVETYYRTGITRANDPSYKSSATVANDGEWHDVIVDLTSLKMTGTLHTMQVRLSVDGGSKTDTVIADIEGIAFFKTEADAKAYTFVSSFVPETEETEPSDDVTADGGSSDDISAETEEEKKGCGSTVAGGVALVAIASLGTCLVRKKKED